MTGLEESMVKLHKHLMGSHLDEGVKLLVTTDGQLQMAGCDTLHLQVIGTGVRAAANQRDAAMACREAGTGWEG